MCHTPAKSWVNKYGRIWFLVLDKKLIIQRTQLRNL